MADEGQDSAAKAFAPPPGRAGVYVYRNEMMGSAIKMDVFLDGKKIGETGAKTYVYTQVSPGKHELMGKAENESRVSFDAVAGRIYYFWQEVKMGIGTARNNLAQVDEAAGKAGVMESKLVAPGN